MSSPAELRYAVKRLYKQMIFLGREYPRGPEKFQQRVHRAFMRNKDETDPEKIKALIAHGEYVVKELEALYYLRKYRAMKQRYYDP